jgi:imidazolonepropionase-like amidohydrolase
MPLRSFHALALSLVLAMPARAHAQVAAFVDVTVIPMDSERELRNHTVVVEGDRIIAVGPSRSTPVPAGATRLDGRGKYLMPGLAEMHAHVVGGQNPNHEQMNRDILFLYVANGITSIRAMLGQPNQLPLRQQLVRGEVLGPMMYVSAPSLNGNSAPNPDSAVKLVRAYKTAGYDFLKIHPGLSRETYDAIVRTAADAGLSWAGHVPAAVGLPHAMTSKQSTVDHLDGMLEMATPDSIFARLRNNAVPFTHFVDAVDSSRFSMIARRMKAARMWSVPTMLIWENIYTQSESPEQMARRSELRYASRQAVANHVAQKYNTLEQHRNQGITAAASAKYLALRRAALKAIADADAPLLMGTDSPQMFMVPGFALHRELAIVSEAGLTPFQIYSSGSRNVGQYVAEHLGQDGRFGTVTVGSRADLVMLDANPLRSIANLSRRAGVMVRGRWVSKAEIEKGLVDLADRYAR